MYNVNVVRRDMSQSELQYAAASLQWQGFGGGGGRPIRPQLALEMFSPPKSPLAVQNAYIVHYVHL